MFHYMHQWNIFVLKNKVKNMNVYYHLPGLFEFYEFYKKFLPLFKNKPEYFYDWCKIGSIYGSPSDCICLVDASVMQIVIQKKYSLW